MKIGEEERSLAESDDEIVHRYKLLKNEGDADELAKRHYSEVYRACLRFFGNADTAKDAAQEAFLRVFMHIGKYQGGDFVSWILRIARNVCISEWRKKRKLAETELPEILHRNEQHESRLLFQNVFQLVATLPEGQGKCLLMKASGYSYDEISARLAIPVRSVKSHIQNGRRMLMKIFSERPV
jgi:RNA polymerase sigma-70 factor (ECF subfamily)